MESVEVITKSNVISRNEINLTGKNVTVLGAARSGIAVARLLKERGANVFVSDLGGAEKLKNSMADLRSMGLSYEVGGHTSRALNADLIVISPGVPSNAPIVREAENAGQRIVSELELASWFCTVPIVAVTGTNGKTTTTTLIGQMFHDARRKYVVAGNIGTAFSGVLNEIDEESVAVLEVSSFQLDHIDSFHPKVSIILNITPDHLDRYDHDFEKYVTSKCRVFQNQTNEDYLIYNFDDEKTRSHVQRLAANHVQTIPFSIQQQFEDGAFVENGFLTVVLNGKRSEVVEIDQISVRGMHNLYNSMAATLAAHLSRVSVPSIRSTLKNFKGVEHRLEFVREVGGVKFVNDSKATNVDSVWYALQSFTEPLIVLIGGRDKGNDYTRLADLVKRHVKTVVAIGESAEKVYEGFSALTKVVRAGSMDEAVRHAQALAVPGDVVLLSPACASFDWFENYEHRGRVFKQIVDSL